MPPLQSEEESGSPWPGCVVSRPSLPLFREARMKAEQMKAEKLAMERAAVEAQKRAEKEAAQRAAEEALKKKAAEEKSRTGGVVGECFT
ncbi:uncharacterized protein LOC116259152 isoform X2 [Nymphaea colorata]|uniref:uncharacterized protein LOC116259152 isoform X2 n=1 Tax=Nymphaea colorata TaxID=210225 RepID=UPI00129D2823|nr:uncharacterized protein LOC116259152 isoform X2 [Nymphaea colorata]